MSRESPESVVFGRYELDMKTRRLCEDGTPVALQPRVLDLLAFLIRHRDRAVDKDEIQDAVWAGTVVSETALTRAIMKARRAVGDSAEQQSVIRTVHGHGYQFVAPVDAPALSQTQAAAVAAEHPEPVPSSERVDSPAAPTHFRRLALGAVLVLAAIAAVSLWRPSDHNSDTLRVAVLPVLNETQSSEFDWVKLGLLGFANDLIQTATSLAVVPASDIVRYAESGAFSKDGSSATDHAAALGKLYGATHIVLSRIEKSVGGLRLEYSLVGADGTVQRSTMVGTQSTELIHGMVREINQQLTSARYLEGDAVSPGTDPFIAEAFSRAMNTALEGRCREALPLFQIVLDRSPDNASARYEWADCTYISGDPAAAAAALKALIDNADGTSNARLARAYALLGTIYHTTGDLENATVTLEQGLATARQLGDDDATGRLLTARARMSRDRRDNEAARQELAQAAVAFRRAGREILPGQLHSALANLAMSESKWTDAETHLEAALGSFRALGDRRNEAMMINNYGYLRRRQGRAAEAEPFHLQSLAIREELGDRVGSGRILGMLSVLYAGQQRFEDARSMAQRAVDIASGADDKLFMATGYAQLAAAHNGLGDKQEAQEAYQRSLELFEQIEDYSRMAQVELRLALLDMDLGHLESAEERISSVMAVATQDDLFEVAAEAHEYAGDLARLRKDAQETERRYQEAMRLIDAHGFMSKRRALRIKLAHHYLDQDQLDRATAVLGQVLSEEPDVQVMKLHARYAHHSGESARAVELLRTAKARDSDRWTGEDQQTLEAYQLAADELTAP